MNIAIDIRNIGRGRTGSEVVVRELTRALLKRDHTHTYYLMTDTHDEEVLSYIRDVLELKQAPHAHLCSIASRGRAVWVLWSAWRFLRKHHIDVFHTEYIVPFFIPRRIKVLTHIHDVSFVALRDKIAKKNLFFLDMLIPRSLRRADRIIAVSYFTKRELLTYFPFTSKKIRVVENALSYVFAHSASDDDQARVQKKYNLPQEMIFSLGSMQPRKNMPFLIAAFARLAERLPSAVLVLSGKHDAYTDPLIQETYHQFPHIRDRVIFTGFVPDKDLPALYASARLFVYPSLYEGFSLPILEAFSQHTSVALSDLPVHHEVAGEGAWYFSPTSLDQCVEVLYDAYTQETQRSVKMSHMHTTLVHYGWDISAKKFLDIIHSLFPS